MIDVISKKPQCFQQWYDEEKTTFWGHFQHHNLIQDSWIQVCLNDFKLPQYVQNINNLQIPMNRVVCNSIIKSFGFRINLLFF